MICTQCCAEKTLASLCVCMCVFVFLSCQYQHSFIVSFQCSSIKCDSKNPISFCGSRWQPFSIDQMIFWLIFSCFKCFFSASFHAYKPNWFGISSYSLFVEHWYTSSWSINLSHKKRSNSNWWLLKLEITHTSSFRPNFFPSCFSFLFKKYFTSLTWSLFFTSMWFIMANECRFIRLNRINLNSYARICFHNSFWG